MHIPDGYLSPQTYVPLFAASGAFWAVGLKKLKRELSVRQAPYLAMAAAFCFLIMMFNIPIPGGTTGHAVGGAAAAILLGPWTAVLSVSVVLVIQAVVFGDGGITAIGANCFNMAVVLPFVSYFVFRLVAGDAQRGRRLSAAAFLSGYLGLVASSVAAGVEFGIQPLIARAPDGTPLYAPYPLSVALPAMALEHLLVFGLVEGFVTMLLVKYFVKNEPSLVLADSASVSVFRKKLWIGLVVLALVSPLGIIIPEMLRAGDAWGEWGPETLMKMLGYLPKGLERLGGLWSAPVPDYGAGAGSAAAQSAWYVVSAFAGAAAAVISAYVITRRLVWKGEKTRRAPDSYVEKGMGHLAGVIRETYVQWELAGGRGLMQGIDPRVKLMYMLSFVVLVSVTHGLAAQAGVFALTALLALASRVDAAHMYRRVLFLGSVFGFLIAFPASVNIITPGRIVLPLFTLSAPHGFWVYHVPREVGLTREGLMGVMLLTMRVVNSVSVSLLVLYTTPFPELVRALKVLRVPDSVLVIITLSYKYIFIFARTVEEMHLARKSRLVGGASQAGPAEARRWAADRIALVFKKTQLHCEEIYKAMLSRGFSGEFRLEGLGPLKGRDYAACAGFGLAWAAIILMA